MSILDTCPCGADFSVSRGRAYDEQMVHRDWLKAHEKCREVACRPQIQMPHFTMPVATGANIPGAASSPTNESEPSDG